MVRGFSNFQLYHTFRRYHRNVNYETTIKNKSKIEGAYLLLKRYKNRLKNFDSALAQIDSNKADKQELAQLAKSLDNQTNLAVFKDMQLLLDTTVQQLEERFIVKCNSMQSCYQNINLDYRKTIQSNNKKYFNHFTDKISFIKKFMNELALEQAKILEGIMNKVNQTYD